MVLVYQAQVSLRPSEYGTVSAFAAYLLAYRPHPLWLAMLCASRRLLMGLLTERLVVAAAVHAPRSPCWCDRRITSVRCLQLATASRLLLSGAVRRQRLPTWAVAVRWQQLLCRLSAFVGSALPFFKTTWAGRAGPSHDFGHRPRRHRTRKMSPGWGGWPLRRGLSGVSPPTSIRPPGFMTRRVPRFRLRAAVVLVIQHPVASWRFSGPVQAFTPLPGAHWVDQNPGPPVNSRCASLCWGVWPSGPPPAREGGLMSVADVAYDEPPRDAISGALFPVGGVGLDCRHGAAGPDLATSTRSAGRTPYPAMVLCR